MLSSISCLANERNMSIAAAIKGPCGAHPWIGDDSFLAYCPRLAIGVIRDPHRPIAIGRCLGMKVRGGRQFSSSIFPETGVPGP